MAPFHMLGMVSCYCAIVTLALRRAIFSRIWLQKCRDLEIRVRGHLRSLNVVPFDRLCMVSYYCSIVTLSVRQSYYIEIFDFKNDVTLKTGLRVREGHWKCKMSPFDRKPMICYWCSIVTMALSRVVSEIPMSKNIATLKFQSLKVIESGTIR